ncbi:hypothetical protein BJ875DRAFT_472301 [Amylocarpus encephaloides]|uniref:Phosphatidylglycerol lysyltransferase C-terminal domain-containing protein n=1 Tax=Amylocarpus encephaloides TaxID=45428 RepID=A0A9P7YB02_9HELO|nr:hypothetical protein BJ875DRAFT_472301 [Amylocarpus encephaloides]
MGASIAIDGPASLPKTNRPRNQKISPGNEKRKTNAKTTVPNKPTFPDELGASLAEQLCTRPTPFNSSKTLTERLESAKIRQTSEIIPISGSSTRHNTEKEFSDTSSERSQSSDSTRARNKDLSSTKTVREVFHLDDFAALAALQRLILTYGKVSHMGILDKSYSFFVTKDRQAALYYKVKDHIAVMGGDPLCPPERYSDLLSEFEKWRKSLNLGIACLGAGEEFAVFARRNKWVTMCFATDRVLNPMTNPVLHSNSGKSIARNVKKLLDVKGAGIKVEAYTPTLGRDMQLEEQLLNVYDEWRDDRNNNRKGQAYITVYDPFGLPDLMTYVYTRGFDGVPNGFAALRTLGSNSGYHLDPYVASPGAPKGITDLLLYSTMALLNTAKVSYLSLGYEPLDKLGTIHGMPKALANISRKVHKKIFQEVHVSGKKGYHDKFHPDETQQSNLYLVFPPGIPSLKHMSAVAHVANIKIRQAMLARSPSPRTNKDDAETERRMSEIVEIFRKKINGGPFRESTPST